MYVSSLHHREFWALGNIAGDDVQREVLYRIMYTGPSLIVSEH